jgi:phage replication-related protein YjqB (UPF0714/DUF867 family)
MRIILFIVFVFQCFPALAQKISSFKELSALKKEGKDFEIKTRVGSVDSLVMAIHGGTMESGTTELADAIAADQFSFYSFTGLADDYQGLHLTSTDFDEPRLSALTQNAKNCLSLHGLKGDEADFCVGGGNAQKRQAYVRALALTFPKWRSCELCCPPNSGTSMKNVVNRCKLPGVQIEMGQSLRAQLKQNPNFLKEVSKVLQVELGKD